MNSTSFIGSAVFFKNSSMTIIESWFIIFDIVTIVCTTLTMALALIYLLIIILTKTCHTVPMMLVANSCLIMFLSGCTLLSFDTVMLRNDLKQINFQDSFCIVRTYISNSLAAAFYYSFLLQAFYRYVIVVYSNHLFWRTVRCQGSIICLTWLFDLLYPIPYMLTDEIIYNVDNQICLPRLRFSFSIIYLSFCSYIIPVSLIMFIYWKLIRYVKEMNKHVTSVNTLVRAKRELKMVRHTIILVTILTAVCFPFAVFTFMSFFTTPPKYYFRIGFGFINALLVFVMIVLFLFTKSLRTSVMNRI